MRDYLKKARKQADFTQAEIAKKVGIARTSYTNIEQRDSSRSLHL